MTITKVGTKAITEKACYELIRGEFDVDEAKEIIDYMLQKKINFHKARDFSNQIRYGKELDASQHRIEELKEAQGQVKELIQKAKAEGKTLRIVSNISVDLI